VSQTFLKALSGIGIIAFWIFCYNINILFISRLNSFCFIIKAQAYFWNIIERLLNHSFSLRSLNRCKGQGGYYDRALTVS
jgi:hypothetical protein